ncbi:hypothetical protein D1007_09012 [Hordeum vulgare]|nr:hypothetical protein D1007_09012 [Hordeum vulgare]
MLGECDGEVLLIGEEQAETVVYRVFRWCLGRKVGDDTSLGGRTLFLGFHGFAACMGPDFPEIRGDCIYAAGRRLGEWCEYSLVNGTCDVCYAEYAGAPPLNSDSPLRPPVWVFPSLMPA